MLDAIREELRLLGRITLDYIAYGVSGFVILILRQLVIKFRKKINMEAIMEKEVLIGSESKVDVKLANGKLYLVAKYDGVDADAELAVGIEVDLLIDKLAEKIPGKLDDAVAQVLKAALKVL